MKRAVAEALDISDVVQEIGLVESVAGTVTVETARGTYRARRAVSCLVPPRAGDRVLVATSATGETFVLAVLERPGDSPLEIAAEGDLELRAPKGRVRVSAAEGVELGTTGELGLIARALRVHAREGSVLVDAIGFVGRLAQLDVERVKGVFGTLDQTLERFSQRVKRAYRFVEEVDVTRAKQIDMRAEQNVHVRGENAMVTAEVLVKMDGKQIHLG